jgi:hypothetical protein
MRIEPKHPKSHILLKHVQLFIEVKAVLFDGLIWKLVGMEVVLELKSATQILSIVYERRYHGISPIQ